MYTFDSRIRYSEVDAEGHLDINAIIDYMQDCTNFHSEDLGVGLAWHKEKRLMWVLNSWQIIIDQYPKMGEHITVGTQSYGCEKMFGHRNFLITDAKGNRVAIANSLWVLMDLKKMRPMIVTPEIAEPYGAYEPLEMDYAPRKISLPGEGEQKEAIVVKEYHLDTNHHVNNGWYVRIARDYLPDNAVIKELRVEYKKQAMLGDEMIPYIYEISDTERIVSLKDTKGHVISTVQFFTV